jgi:heme-degrading monooxygenase HmoA
MNSNMVLNPGQCPAHRSEGGASPLQESSFPVSSGANFVVISKFAVANGMTSQVKEAFRNRPHKVDGADGFLRMEVISPIEDPDEIWLITFWHDEVSYKTWHHSHLYRESHEGIPKGLKLVPKSAGIRCYESVSS